MTYFAFLALFLGIPLGLLSIVTVRDYQRGKWMPRSFGMYKPWKIILLLCVVAFIYTTPWDNYLVATGVWYYDLQLVTGIVLGYVPIEEYTFFVLLPVFTGLFTLLLMRYMTPGSRLDPVTAVRVRTALFILILGLWIGSCAAFVLSISADAWKPLTYLALILVWMLPPVLLQIAFAGDILVQHWRIVSLSFVLTTLYLGAADAVAITAGTWTIDPQQSLPVFLFGILPVEEFIFFAVVNLLVIAGITLLLAEESARRVHEMRRYGLLRPLADRLVAILPHEMRHDQSIELKDAA
jgi:lycopene cyclase domain-containing protein